jgi:ATP-binding cassette subfamily B protein/subfamily B ATP-binding cassette protein MsbA
VREVLDAQDEVPDRGARALDDLRGELVFESVSFGYDPAERLVLRDVSFAAGRGRLTAIVGATGAGKTSLVSLLARFWDPSLGRILLDGHDLRDVALRSLRENVSLVLQEPVLFPLSVAENIAFGRPDASLDEIVEAARTARAHDFVERLPEGYDTLLDNRAARLSGGERQRIALARAILKDAPILVLDEPTSSLDARTESEIFDALAATLSAKTVFLVSHRLSTILRADQILVLENGGIAEAGTHDELIARGGVYERLYRYQQHGVIAQPELAELEELQPLLAEGNGAADR